MSSLSLGIAATFGAVASVFASFGLGYSVGLDQRDEEARDKRNTAQSRREADTEGTRSKEGRNNLRNRHKKATSIDQFSSASAPYSWQFKEEDSRFWDYFGPFDNDVLERLYCKVENLEVNVVLEDTAISALFLSSCHSVNFEEMSMSSHSYDKLSLRRLSGPSYMPEPNTKSSTQWVWYWEDNDGWKKYAETLQEEIEAEYLKKEESYSLKIGVYDYLITFDDKPMCQSNMDSGTMRQVRRRPLLTKRTSCGDPTEAEELDKRLPDSCIPSHWSPVPCEQYTHISLSTLSKEFEEVEQLFRKSMKREMKIEKISRVQNRFMWETYCRKKENMIEKAKGDQRKVNEKRLFHGTNPRSVEAICKNNFDWRLNGKNATAYGKGSYFAVEASYSHNYAKEDGNKSRFMFLAKVLAGSYTEGESSYPTPPRKEPSNPTSDLYDSCVDDESNPTIFVVFDKNQLYPEYIIQYRSS